jgi:hypothetical protein
MLADSGEGLDRLHMKIGMRLLSRPVEMASSCTHQQCET